MAHWLDRYLQGQHVEVWTEITSAGAIGQLRDEDREEAVAVAEEIMRRCRTNVDRLVQALPERGYVLDPGEGLHPRVVPAATVASDLDGLEARVGPLPIALRCWYEQVGEVNLVGRHPTWTFDLTDPLVVQAPIDYVLGEVDAWEADRGTEWDRGSFVLDIGPDDLHKANVSGGAPYSLLLPNPGADGLLLWERHQTTFVNHLRESFRWGGFPGFARCAEPVPAMVQDLAALLVAI